MASIASSALAVHCIRVILPNGDVHDVSPAGACGLRRALRVANALAGWLAVDEWEVASRFVPEGVRKIRKDLRKEDPELDLLACRVQVVAPTKEGEDAPGGYEAVATYRVGEAVPELLSKLREETGEAGWRADAGHRPKGPRSNRPTTFADHPSTN